MTKRLRRGHRTDDATRAGIKKALEQSFAKVDKDDDERMERLIERMRSFEGGGRGAP